MNEREQLTAPLPVSWRVFLVLVVLCGAVLRFVNLEKKPYWLDETYTSLRVSGYDETDDAPPRLYTGRVITSADVQIFQRANSDTPAIGTVRGLARREPHLPPVYFLAARAAAHWLGDTVAATRGVSVICGVLSLLALFWLCLEWSGDQVAAWLAMGLAAVSPLLIRFAQEARPYSMWMAAILLANVAFLRMTREPGRSNSALYALSLAFALYVQLLTILTVLAHGVYFLLSGMWRQDRVRRHYLAASAAATLCLAPWIGVLLIKRKTAVAMTSWQTDPAPLERLLEGWAKGITALMPGWPVSHPAAFLVAVAVVLLVGYALHALYRDTPRSAWLYPLLLIVIPVAPFVLLDLSLGGQRSTATRYMLPAFLIVEVAVAHLLARGIRRRLWQALALAILVTGIIASVAVVRTETWWGLSKVEVDLARILNQSPRPLVISDAHFGMIAPLSHLVHPDVGFLLNQRPTNLDIRQGYDPVYVCRPSNGLREAVEQRPGWKLHPVYQEARKNGVVFSLFWVVREGNGDE